MENDLVDIPHKKVKDLKVPNRNTMTKVASDLLTIEEITAMLKACEQSRDRALITMLYEGGFRIGEIGMMRWGDIQFDRFGVVVNVMFKTNKPRYIRLVMSREHLARWKNDYPRQPITNDMPVFFNRKEGPALLWNRSYAAQTDCGQGETYEACDPSSLPTFKDYPLDPRGSIRERDKAHDVGESDHGYVSDVCPSHRD